MAKKKLLRKLAMGPVLVASAIIFAVLSLLGLLRFNPPSMEDAADSAPSTEAMVMAPVSSETASSDAPQTDSEQNDSQTTPPQPVDVVDVLIDGDTYLVGAGESDGQLQRQSRTIDQITAECRQCEGDASGIRVRITRTFDATAESEQALTEALAAAGLTDDEIDFRRTLVQSPP